jgi:hypothetical protein
VVVGQKMSGILVLSNWLCPNRRAVWRCHKWTRIVGQYLRKLHWFWCSDANQLAQRFENCIDHVQKGSCIATKVCMPSTRNRMDRILRNDPQKYQSVPDTTLVANNFRYYTNFTETKYFFIVGFIVNIVKKFVYADQSKEQRLTK